MPDAWHRDGMNGRAGRSGHGLGFNFGVDKPLTDKPF